MLNSLLYSTIDRMESLLSFYSSERISIENKAKKGRKQNAFGFTLDTYLHILSSGTEDEKSTESYLQMQETLKNYVSVIDSCEQDGYKKVFYRLVDADKLRAEGVELDPTVATKKFRQFLEMPDIHSDNTLVMLITRFEEFISRLLGEIYFMFPKKYLDNQEIKFSEIIGVGIDEVRSNIVEREIDSIMRKSYEEWFDIFRSHNMNFSACDKEMKLLREIYARRNVIVHNSGKVNSSYLKMVPNSDKKVGDRLYSDQSYILSAFSTVKVVIYSISIEAARLLKENKERYLNSIFNLVFDELQKQNYSVTSNIFAQLSVNKVLDNNTKLMSKVNNWISRIEIDGRDEVRKEVEEMDVSALDKSFLLAKLVLLEDYWTAKKVLDGLYKHEQISTYELETWPLFMHFRNSDAYCEFKKEHAEDFEVSAVEVDQMPTIEDTENAKKLSAKLENQMDK